MADERVTPQGYDYPGKVRNPFWDGGGGGTTSNVDATVVVDDTTGTPDASVTKRVVDDTTIFDFSFTGLKGATGEQGAQGPQGEQGPQGLQGIQGIQGEQGPTGPAGNDGADGISPTVTVRSITGGTQIEIVSAGGTERFDVMDGTDGAAGAQGPAGPGVSAGGNQGDILAKASGADYDTEWIPAPSGGTSLFDKIDRININSNASSVANPAPCVKAARSSNLNTLTFHGVSPTYRKIQTYATISGSIPIATHAFNLKTDATYLPNFEDVFVEIAFPYGDTDPADIGRNFGVTIPVPIAKMLSDMPVVGNLRSSLVYRVCSEPVFLNTLSGEVPVIIEADCSVEFDVTNTTVTLNFSWQPKVISVSSNALATTPYLYDPDSIGDQYSVKCFYRMASAYSLSKTDMENVWV